MAIITLTTDFGTSDGYVAVMKGVILGIAPRASLVDVSHSLPCWSIESAAWILANSYAYFPAETVHLAVVDPGVGSARRAIAVRAQNRFFVGPDNGVFWHVFDKVGPLSAIELTEQRWHLPSKSTTFHGRDVFAPVAAHLSSGTPLRKFGRAIDPETLVRLPNRVVAIDDSGITGAVVYIDHFGNLITNIEGSKLKPQASICVGKGVDLKLKQTYSEVSMGTAVAFVGSHGFLEIALNCGSAKETLEADLGVPVKVIQ